MLSADHVLARRSKGELQLVKLGDDTRRRALELAAAYLEAARAAVGQTRDDLEEAWGQAAAAASDEGSTAHGRIAAGLRKLVDDDCVFDGEPDDDPVELRLALFTRAREVRAALEDDGTFDRALVLRAEAEARGLAPEELERQLYADLRGANVLREAPRATAEAVVARYELGQAQAVLLRAVRVVCLLPAPPAAAARAFFRTLKFLRLLHAITPVRDEGNGGRQGYRVEIDGPYSLFESVTKYGLALALIVPHLAAFDEWVLEADVRWGKERAPLVFRLRSPQASSTRSPGAVRRPSEELPDEVAALLRAFEGLSSPWKARVAHQILDLPGVGLCVPDLVFERPRHTGGVHRVFLEVMGYWSRDAVWKRVELVQKGLPHRVLFAVSQRLRVSEAVLDDEAGRGALYVYKGTMSATRVAARLDALVDGAG